MGNVLYEATYEFDFFCLIPLFMFIVACFFPRLIKKTCLERGAKVNEKVIKIFSLFVQIILSIFVIFTIINEVVSYNQIIVAYENGNYDTVEGYVENFSPMSYEGHSEESFNIKDIEFSYSDYVITQGYHNTASHGGVITHNGQHLKIGYITDDFTEKNTIVYIEVIS